MDFFNMRRLRGLAARIQLGKGGPNLKAETGKILVRNAADSGLAILQAATGISGNDLVTKAQLDAVPGGGALKWTTHHGLNQSSTAENFVPHNFLQEATSHNYFQKILCTRACKITAIHIQPRRAIGITDFNTYTADGVYTTATLTFLKGVQIDCDTADIAYEFDFSGDPPLFAKHDLAVIGLDTTDDGPDETTISVDWEAQ